MRKRICRLCPEDISHRAPNAIYCETCAALRDARRRRAASLAYQRRPDVKERRNARAREIRAQARQFREQQARDAEV